MTNNKRLEKICKSILKGTLKVNGKSKQWGNYYLNIQQLFWERNLQDGQLVSVMFLNKHIGTIDVDNNLDSVIFY